MGDGSLIYIILIGILIILNYLAIYLSNKISLWISGIIIGFLGPVIAYTFGVILVKIEHSRGGTGEGAAYVAAIIGFIIIANGFIYFIIGLASKIKKYLEIKKSTN